LAIEGLRRQPNCPRAVESAERHSGAAWRVVLERQFQTGIFKLA